MNDQFIAFAAGPEVQALATESSTLRAAIRGEAEHAATIAELEKTIKSLLRRANHKNKDAVQQLSVARAQLEMLKAEAGRSDPIGEAKEGTLEALKAATAVLNAVAQRAAEAEFDRFIRAVYPFYERLQPSPERYAPASVFVRPLEPVIIPADKDGAESREIVFINDEPFVKIPKMPKNKWEKADKLEVSVVTYHALARFFELLDGRYADQMRQDGAVGQIERLRDQFRYLHIPSVEAARRRGFEVGDIHHLRPSQLVQLAEHFLSRVGYHGTPGSVESPARAECEPEPKAEKPSFLSSLVN